MAIRNARPDLKKKEAKNVNDKIFPIKSLHVCSYNSSSKYSKSRTDTLLSKKLINGRNPELEH